MCIKGSIRKFLILEAYMMDEDLAYKVKVDGIDGDFICNSGGLRYLFSKFYCPIQSKYRTKRGLFSPLFCLRYNNDN